MRLSKVLERKVSTRMYIPFIIACIALVLVVALIVAATQNAGRSGTIDSARNSLGAAEYTELAAALASFDTVGYPNADLMGDIMPTLRLHFHCAERLDSVLTGEFGEKYSLLDAEVYRYIQLTMSEIENAFAQGLSTSQGVENMGVYMLMLRQNLTGRFDAGGNLLPAG